jgi:hypothetical protein
MRMKRREPGSLVQINLRFREETRRALENAAIDHRVSFTEEAMMRLEASLRRDAKESLEHYAAEAKKAKQSLKDLAEETKKIEEQLSASVQRFESAALRMETALKQSAPAQEAPKTEVPPPKEEEGAK